MTLLRVAHFHTRDQRACEMEDAEGDLARAAEQLRSRGITVHTLLVTGEPQEVIVQQAAELHPDLIAMATHGHGWAKRMVLGSVADHVRHNTDVPLLLLKGGRRELSRRLQRGLLAAGSGDEGTLPISGVCCR